MSTQNELTKPISDKQDVLISELFLTLMEHIWDADPFQVYHQYGDALKTARIFNGQVETEGDKLFLRFPDDSLVIINNNGTSGELVN